jgi:hypothetical protein
VLLLDHPKALFETRFKKSSYPRFDEDAQACFLNQKTPRAKRDSPMLVGLMPTTPKSPWNIAKHRATVERL